MQKIGDPIKVGLRQRLGTPSLADLCEIGSLEPTPAALVESLFGPTGLEALTKEWEVLATELDRRRKSVVGTYPENFDVAQGAGFLAYVLTRIVQPEHILETGVANGDSSFFFLAALQRNGKGTLHSVDIRWNVGGHLSDSERESWDLRVLDRAHPKRSFEQIASALPRVDVFMHDSAHTYGWMHHEFSVMAKLMPRGLWLCDDADASFAWLHACRRAGVAPHYVVDERKLVGVMRF